MDVILVMLLVFDALCFTIVISEHIHVASTSLNIAGNINQYRQGGVASIT